MPSIQTDDLNGIYLRMTLKAFKRIDYHRLIIHIDKLFRYILPHTMARATCYYYRIVHFLTFSNPNSYRPTPHDSNYMEF